MYLLVRDILGSDGVLHTAVLVVYQVTKKQSLADGEISLVWRVKLRTEFIASLQETGHKLAF